MTVGHASTQFELIAAQMRSPEVLRRIKELKAKFAGKTIICNKVWKVFGEVFAVIGKFGLCVGGVDRLGRLSGILLKLRTFRQFLKVYPAYRNKVVLVQLAVSRTTTTHTSPENRITLSKRVRRSGVFFGIFVNCSTSELSNYQCNVDIGCKTRCHEEFSIVCEFEHVTQCWENRLLESSLTTF